MGTLLILVVVTFVLIWWAMWRFGNGRNWFGGD